MKLLIEYEDHPEMKDLLESVKSCLESRSKVDMGSHTIINVTILK